MVTDVFFFFFFMAQSNVSFLLSLRSATFIYFKLFSMYMRAVGALFCIFYFVSIYFMDVHLDLLIE